MYNIVNFVNCIECNSTVSESAWSCPKCGSVKFKGVTCVGCNRLSKITDVEGTKVNWYKAYHPVSFDHRGSGYIHKQCKDKISQEEVKIDEILPDISFHCSACRQEQFINAEAQERFKHNSTSGRERLSEPNQVCKHCGHRNELDTGNHLYADCCFCGHGLLTNKAVKFQLTQGDTSIVFSHRFCYNSRREKIKTIAFLNTTASMLCFLAFVVSPTIAGMMFFKWGIGFIPSFLTGGAIYLAGMIGIGVCKSSASVEKTLWPRRYQ